MLASDEEGNSYGDVDDAVSVDGKPGKTIITFYPNNCMLAEDVLDLI